MTTEHTLLSFITRRYTTRREDAATDALGFVLNRSAVARKGLSALLEEAVPGISPVASLQNQFAVTDSAFPDLACFDADGEIQALIEAKFWASLTHNQSNTYWERLPSDAPSALVFLAPTERLDDLLVAVPAGLTKIGVYLKEVNRGSDLIVLRDNMSQRHLILISWAELLTRLEQSATEGRDWQALFELTQVGGIASSEYQENDVTKDKVLRALISDAIAQARQKGWVNTDGLSHGGSDAFPGRYFRLAGAYAFLGVHHEAWKQTGKPFWLVFGEFGSAPGEVTTAQVHERMGSRGCTGKFNWNDGEYRVTLDLHPAGIDLDARVQFIVDQLQDIARQINPEAFQNHEQ